MGDVKNPSPQSPHVKLMPESTAPSKHCVQIDAVVLQFMQLLLQGVQEPVPESLN